MGPATGTVCQALGEGFMVRAFCVDGDVGLVGPVFSLGRCLSGALHTPIQAATAHEPNEHLCRSHTLSPTNNHNERQRYLPVLVPLLAQTTQLDVGFSVEDAADEEEDGVIASSADGAKCVWFDFVGWVGAWGAAVDGVAGV